MPNAVQLANALMSWPYLPIFPFTLIISDPFIVLPSTKPELENLLDCHYLVFIISDRLAAPLVVLN